MCRARQHVLDGGDQAFRLQVARPQTVTAGVQRRHVLDVLVSGIACMILFLAVFQTLGNGGAHFAHQRQVFGQRLVGAFQHGHALLALQYLAQHVAGERTVHGHVDHAHLDLAILAQPVGDGGGLHGHAALAEDDVIGIVAAVGVDTAVAAAGQCLKLLGILVEQRGDMIEEIRTLCSHGLHVGILIGDHAGLHRIVHIPDRRHAAALGSVQHLLCRCRRVDDVVGIAQIFGDQFAFRHHHRLDQVRGQETVLADDGRCQRLFGGFARDHVEVGRFLRILRHHLDEAGVVGAVVVVMRAVHVQRSLGDGAAAEVQHVGQTLADGGIQRFVHESEALRGGEVHRAQTGHRQAGSNTGSGVFGFRLDEDQWMAAGVEMALGNLFRPVFAHLRGGSDRVGARALRRFALHHDHGGIAVDGVARAGIFEFGVGTLGAGGSTDQLLLDLVQHDYFPYASTVAGNGSIRMIFLAALPLMTLSPSSQTMAPVGQRSIALRLAASFLA